MVDFHACETDYHRCLPAWVEARRKRCECGNVLRPCSKCDDNKPMVQFTMGETVRKTGLGVVPAKFDSGSEHVMTRAHRSEPRCHGQIRRRPNSIPGVFRRGAALLNLSSAGCLPRPAWQCSNGSRAGTPSSRQSG